MIYADSSAVVKRYVEEVGSDWVHGLFTAIPLDQIIIAAITGVEVVAAITRRMRSGTITLPDAASSCALFLADLNADYLIIPITDGLLNHAISLARLHGLRGYDAVQLAAALEVNRLRLGASLSPIVFVSADKELNFSARSEGLVVDDPNDHS